MKTRQFFGFNMSEDQLEERLEVLEVTVQSLIHNHASERLFREVFGIALDILCNYGQGFQFLQWGERKLDYSFGDEDSGYIHLAYKGGISRDNLEIDYERPGTDSAKLHLLRKRGISADREFAKKDDVELVARGLPPLADFISRGPYFIRVIYRDDAFYALPPCERPVLAHTFR